LVLVAGEKIRHAPLGGAIGDQECFFSQ